MIYVFQGGTQVIEIRVQHIKELEIKANNQLIRTGDEFVPMSKLLGEEKSEELRKALVSVFESYLLKEFSKMGYAMIKKTD